MNIERRIKTGEERPHKRGAAATITDTAQTTTLNEDEASTTLVDLIAASATLAEISGPVPVSE